MEPLVTDIRILSGIIGLLTGVLTYLAWQNGRWMKQAHRDTQRLIDDGNIRVERLIKEMHDDTQKFLDKIDLRLEKMDQRLENINQHAEKRHREVVDLLAK